MTTLLAINTATANTEIAFLRDGKVVLEDSWPAKANESDRILPFLRDSEISFDEIDELFVVSGPGQFTALRVGVTIVNTLAHTLKVPIYTMDTFEMATARSGLTQPHYVVLSAGGKKVFWDKFPDRLESPKLGEVAPDDLPHAEMKTGFGDMLVNFEKGTKCDIVKPFYVKPPSITVKRKAQG